SEEYGIAVGSGLRCLTHADVAAGTAYIVDIELFSETLRQFLSGEPREDVGRAARRKWHNHAHSSFGIGLRPCNTRHWQRGSARGQMQKLSAGKFHFEPPSLERLYVRAPWQAHGERRAFAVLARHGHIAAHHARELAREGKAKSRAPETLCSRGIGLTEFFEQLCLLFRGHADTRFSDRELDPAATIGNPARPQPDLAFL